VGLPQSGWSAQGIECLVILSKSAQRLLGCGLPQRCARCEGASLTVQHTRELCEQS
jgi:hypothetical protein